MLASVALPYCPNNYKTRSVQEEYRSSQCVLIVEVLSKEGILDTEGFFSHYKYELSVQKRFKGKCPKTLTIMDENDSGRFDMTIGKQYLIFIEDMNSIDIASCCGNSGLLADKKAVVAELNKLSHHTERRLKL